MVDDEDHVKYVFGMPEREVGGNKVLWSLTLLCWLALFDNDVNLVNND